MPPNWRDLSLLSYGTLRQKRAYYALHALNIFSVLQDFDPVLTSTISLGIDIPNSDLDIICEVYELDRFQTVLKAAFGAQQDFQSWKRAGRGLPGVVARFHFQGFAIEIFGEPQPVEQQNAYRHLSIAARLLEMAGEEAREAIRQLKANGLKTEPAFAQYFGLSGDPYQTLLELETVSDQELWQTIAAHSCTRVD